MIADHEKALADFVASCRRRNLAPVTVEGQVRVVRRFLVMLGNKPVASATTRDVRRFLARVARTSSSVDRYLSMLRGFFAAVSPGPTYPTDGLTIERGERRPPLVLSPDAVKRFLVVALDADARGRGFRRLRKAFALRDRALVEILYGLGMRASEVVAIRVADLDLVGGTLLVRAAKRGTNRVLPLPPSSLPHLRRYIETGRPRLVRPSLDDEGALFLNVRGRPLHRIAGLIGKLGHLAGTRAHPHAFRRAVATHLVREGASLPAVKELLGHAELDTTALHVAVDRQDLHRAVEAVERDHRV